MNGRHRILAIVAHPGDEALGPGAALARYADAGADVHLVCATRGEAARFGSSRSPFPAAVLARMRERELEASAEVLGVRDLRVLGHPDGGLAGVEPFRAQMAVATEIRRIRPHVVVVVGPHAVSGHADHVALSQTALGAVLAAARHSAPVAGGHAPHAVRKLYELGWSARTRGAFGEIGLVGGSRAEDVPPSELPDWMIQAVLDTRDHAGRALAALSCYGSRSDLQARLRVLGEADARGAWGRTEFRRSLSSVALPMGIESDLLVGILVPAASANRAA